MSKAKAKADRRNMPHGTPQTPAPYQSADERAAQGKALREKSPRTSHAGWKPPKNRRDPVELLSEVRRARSAFAPHQG